MVELVGDCLQLLGEKRCLGQDQAIWVFHEGLVVQKAMDPKTDVKEYVRAMKAMMVGLFWQGTPTGRGAASRKE